MKRILHLVRTTLPADVVGPGDLVVYTAESLPEALRPCQASGAPDAPEPVQAAPYRVWILEPHAAAEHRARPIDSHELCELLFAHDSVAVW